MIVFECPSCHNELRVPNSAAGRTGKCRVCRKPVSVPVSNVELEPVEDEWADLSEEEYGETEPPPLPARQGTAASEADEDDPNVARQKAIASRQPKPKQGQPTSSSEKANPPKANSGKKKKSSRENSRITQVVCGIVAAIVLIGFLLRHSPGIGGSPAYRAGYESGLMAGTSARNTGSNDLEGYRQIQWRLGDMTKGEQGMPLSKMGTEEYGDYMKGFEDGFWRGRNR